jgi:hypothetical protein
VIRPEEIKSSASILEAIEKQFDAAIRKAELGNEWPAVVYQTPVGAGLDDIDKVIKMYRDAGWDVWTGPRYRAAISKPVAP